MITNKGEFFDEGGDYNDRHDFSYYYNYVCDPGWLFEIWDCGIADETDLVLDIKKLYSSYIKTDMPMVSFYEILDIYMKKVKAFENLRAA